MLPTNKAMATRAIAIFWLVIRLFFQVFLNSGRDVIFGPEGGQINGGSLDPGDQRPDDFGPSDLRSRLGADV